MQRFYQTHNELLVSVKSPITRELRSEIDWRNRLIGIKGTRGIGKTIFLLDYIKSNFGTDKSCLYVNLNNFYFSRHSLLNFANEFRKTGGKTLVLDQVFKYPEWSVALSDIYDKFPDLQIIFTGSPVMRLDEANSDLFGKVAAYNLRGLSFREYLNYVSNQNFSKYSLDDILKYHTEIAKDILFKVKPLAYFKDYMQHGFYPFFTENVNFKENVIKIVNLTLEIDIPFLQQMELKYLSKLKKLIYELSENMPHTPNISQLSNSIETSRATVLNYLKYLRNAKLINMIYDGDVNDAKKPERVFLQNPNLLHAIDMNQPSQEALLETYFLNQFGDVYKISGNGKKGEFIIGDELVFKIGNNKRITSNDGKTYIATDMEEVGNGNKIPLWLFGFLY
ncbi:MAG: ATP-binding protein [Bacteroidetes bacterium]|nr:MAG: ATP-binding protein [Bacteroidota bacterium]